MAELLTHVLVAYVVATVLSWRYESITTALVTAMMAGALFPDLRKIYLVVPGEAITATLGVPFSWAPLHRLGGLVVCLLLAVVLVGRPQRRLTVALLSVGAFSHVFLDGLLYQVDGRVFRFFWPLTTYGIPFQGWYKSFDLWPLAVALPLAVATAAVSIHRKTETATEERASSGARRSDGAARSARSGD